MKYLIILLPLIVFSAEYYDLCFGKEYTVAKERYIDYGDKDKQLKDIDFSVWIKCTGKDMNLTTPHPEVPETLDINGHTYLLKKKHSAYCVPFGEKHYMNKTSDIYWMKCRREGQNDWAESA